MANQGDGWPDGWLIREMGWLRGRWVANQGDGWLRGRLVANQGDWWPIREMGGKEAMGG